EQALVARSAAERKAQPGLARPILRRPRRGCDDVLEKWLTRLLLDFPHQPEQLVIDAQAKISLSRAVMQEERWYARRAFDAEAKCREIEGQDFERLDCSRRSIPSHIDRKIDAVMGERNARFRVVTDHAPDDRIEFFAHPPERAGLLVPKCSKPVSLCFKLC